MDKKKLNNVRLDDAFTRWNQYGRLSNAVCSNVYTLIDSLPPNCISPFFMGDGNRILINFNDDVHDISLNIYIYKDKIEWTEVDPKSKNPTPFIGSHKIYDVVDDIVEKINKNYILTTEHVLVAKKNEKKLKKKERLLNQFIQTDNARKTIAKSMASPISRNLDYKSVTRKFVHVKRIGRQR